MTLTLEALRDNEEVDMFTTVFVGNRQTMLLNGRMVTPRGYLQRARSGDAAEEYGLSRAPRLRDEGRKGVNG